jgi:chemotaxis response regulator CheB
MKIDVLIIEDDFIIQMFLEEVIIKIGCNVIGVTDNSKDCISMIEELSPDIIIMDVNIDGKVNGIDTAQLIYERYKIPLVFITGNFHQLTKEVIEKTNPVYIIKKPVDETTLTLEFLSVCKELEIKHNHDTT